MHDKLMDKLSKPARWNKNLCAILIKLTVILNILAIPFPFSMTTE